MISPRFAVRLGVLLWLFPAGFGVAAAQPAGAIEPLDHAICRLIEGSARADHLPVAFLTRIIWRESSFRAAVISPAGAEGIAQFMPQTATQRGLADPFDPEQAIPKAARLLADLRRRFGNLGIAAAAYNAGPARVASWLRGRGDLPSETRAYVRFVSERGVAAWTGPDSLTPPNEMDRDFDPEPAPVQSCLAVASESAPGSRGRLGCRPGFRGAGSVGRAARRQFLEGTRARRLRAPAPALCRRYRRPAPDGHRAAAAQPRHAAVLSGPPAHRLARGRRGIVQPDSIGRRRLRRAAQLTGRRCASFETRPSGTLLRMRFS